LLSVNAAATAYAAPDGSPFKEMLPEVSIPPENQDEGVADGHGIAASKAQAVQQDSGRLVCLDALLACYKLADTRTARCLANGNDYSFCLEIQLHESRRCRAYRDVCEAVAEIVSSS
jgi:hypothetical protein